MRTAARPGRSLKAILEVRHTDHDQLELVWPRLCSEFGEDAYLAQLDTEGYRTESIAIYLG